MHDKLACSRFSLIFPLPLERWEFDLHTGKRGERTDHIRELLKFITGAEDILVVNNNAAAVFFILKSLSGEEETGVSAGLQNR